MSKFNKRIDEMLVVLNAKKKQKKNEEEKEYRVDPISSAMNDALGRFGMSVIDDKPEPEPEPEEDPIEGSIEDMEDLDLPRPADDSEGPSEDNGDDGDEDGEEEGDTSDFNFLDVGGPTEVDPTDTENFKDEGEAEYEGSEEGDNKVGFQYVKGKGLIVKVGDEEAVISDEQMKTVKEFLCSIEEHPEDAINQGIEDVLDSQGKEEEEDDSEGDDGEEKETDDNSEEM